MFVHDYQDWEGSNMWFRKGRECFNLEASPAHYALRCFISDAATIDTTWKVTYCFKIFIVLKILYCIMSEIFTHALDVSLSHVHFC